MSIFLKSCSITAKISVFYFVLVSFIYLFSPIIVFADSSKFAGRIAVVDVQSILEHSVAVQNIRKSIDFLGDEIQREVAKREKELKLLEENLTSTRSSLSEEEFAKKVEDFNKQVNMAQKDMQNKKSKLEHAHSEAIHEVHNITISIIADLAKKYDFNIVLPSSQVLFITDELNLTEEVVQLLNEKLKTVKISYQ